MSLKARTTKNNRLNLATTPINVKKLCSNAVKIEANILPVVIKSVKKNDVIALETVLVKSISEQWLALFKDDEKDCKEQVASVVFKTFSAWKSFRKLQSCWYLAYQDTCIPNIWLSWCKDKQWDRLLMTWLHRQSRLDGLLKTQ